LVEEKKKMCSVKLIRLLKRNKVNDKPLPPDLLRKMNAYWRAANYLSIGQIYFYDNPLLKNPLKREQT
jgi:xylulose-5-phosphate/fructose-6-phosphate phosphoketolase